MKACSLTALCHEITLEFQREAKGPRVASMLASYAASESGWRRFAFGAPDCYTRNLVFKDATYELLVLCWGQGQESPIHNHMGQNCWMAVLDGRIEEVQFLQQPGGRPGPLIEKCSRAYERGQVAYISDDIALHLVRPLRGSSGVSLHLYSRPFDLCKVYDRDTGAESQKLLAYHSIHGEPCPGALPILSSRAHGSRTP